MAEFVMPNCAAINPDAGATIEDETGLMKVNAEIMAVAAHFRLKVQLRKEISNEIRYARDMHTDAAGVHRW